MYPFNAGIKYDEKHTLNPINNTKRKIGTSKDVNLYLSFALKIILTKVRQNAIITANPILLLEVNNVKISNITKTA